MWISKKKFIKLEKRIADLETQVQSQHGKSIDDAADKVIHRMGELLKAQNKANFC